MAARPGPCDLRLAICRQDVDAVRALLAAGADPSQVHARRTPLSWAQQGGQLAMVAALLAAGADANRRSSDALERVEPPLITAIRLGQDAIFAALLAAGADPGAVDFFERTPLWTAVWHRRLGMAWRLVAAGAAAAVAGGWQQCPLYLAARQPCAGWRRLALLLAMLGAPPDRADAEGRSSLWWALRDRDEPLARALLACGARLPAGCPPLDDADPELLRALRQPRRLAELCRIRIRGLVGASGMALPQRLAHLPLPEPLIDYLQLREFGGALASAGWPD